MKREEISKLLEDFLKNYDEEVKTNIWKKHSQAFRDFWNNKIMDDNIREVNESEVDQIIRILDRQGKGNTKADEAVAKVMIAQGVWRRMFKEIKQHKPLRELLSAIFAEKDIKKEAMLIDDLYRMNEGKKNGLTGKSGNAINTMLFVVNPDKYCSVVSLNDRRRAIEYFGFIDGPDFDNDPQGLKIIKSNLSILKGFQTLGITATPRTISCFLYQSPIKDYWKTEEETTECSTLDESQQMTVSHSKEESDIALFYMESQLEDFLIENWDKTELGKEYDLIEENGDLLSQQYSTGIGKIDILAQDKKTKQYVVIELKRNQTSDDTVGQLTRYMGWLEEHKTNGKPTKGIIIAATYDERLHYALKKVKDVEVYLYKVDFKLEEFRKR